jgi:hypothetical protein
MTASTMVRTDEEIQRDVVAELKWDARIGPNEIGVMVTNGVVILTGWVDSYSKKWAAERAAHRVRGVKAVANSTSLLYARPARVGLTASVSRIDCSRLTCPWALLRRRIGPLRATYGCRCVPP